MKSKLSVSVDLDEEVVDAVDEAAREGESRSRTIERLLRRSVVAGRRIEVDDMDRKVIDEHADELNEEALDVLDFQAELT